MFSSHEAQFNSINLFPCHVHTPWLPFLPHTRQILQFINFFAEILINRVEMIEVFTIASFACNVVTCCLHFTVHMIEIDNQNYVDCGVKITGDHGERRGSDRGYVGHLHATDEYPGEITDESREP